jgi:nucleotide-binding universal stress UspA family protein
MSPFKSILVHIDSSSHCAPRLQNALHLARTHGADLTALYAVTPLPWLYAGAFAIGAEASAGMSEFEAERLARASSIFKTAAGDAKHVTWAQASDLPVRDVARHACYADLLVLGQRDPAQPSAGDVPADFVESVIIDSGKPALVIPHIGAADPIGRVAVVAWKETRESARAVAAALPLLHAPSASKSRRGASRVPRRAASRPTSRRTCKGTA